LSDDVGSTDDFTVSVRTMMVEFGSVTTAAFGSAENDCDFTVSVCTLIGKFAWFAGRVADLFETAVLKVD
jgi:hypothetical protein